MSRLFDAIRGLALGALLAGCGAAEAGPMGRAAPSACPPEMVSVAGRFCIDRFEAAVQERVGKVWRPATRALRLSGRAVRAVPADGIRPYGHVSEKGAALACEASGKRLCTSAEWLEACRGPQESVYPYGNEHRQGACNDDYKGRHPVIDLFGTSEGVWDGKHMNDPAINRQPDTVLPGGASPECVSGWGVYDMHGNLHEWVSDPSGVFRGGFYADAAINGEGCLYATTAHGPGYRDYSTGFRCCSDPPAADR